MLPRAWIEDSIEIQFENTIFPISAYYDAWLTQLYGDWRTPPSLAERKCKEHVAILDLDHLYTEHLEEQRTMQIENYTRSIQ